LLENWMQRPHWREWWGEVETELGYIRDMVEGRDTTRPYLFELDGEPAGYIQAWIIADHLREPWLGKTPWLRDVPADSIGVDLAIGNIENLSRGLGTAALKAFAEMLMGEGHCHILIDPDAANLRAIRAYQKAGFEELLIAPDPERNGQSIMIMQLAVDGNQAQSSNQAGIQG
jgi:RimJ/RimL family protein N-acetyltransferase